MNKLLRPILLLSVAITSLNSMANISEDFDQAAKKFEAYNKDLYERNSKERLSQIFETAFNRALINRIEGKRTESKMEMNTVEDDAVIRTQQVRFLQTSEHTCEVTMTITESPYLRSMAKYFNNVESFTECYSLNGTDRFIDQEKVKLKDLNLE